jgi:hypothetical protein
MLHSVGSSASFTPRGEATINFNPSKRSGSKAIHFSAGARVPTAVLRELMARDAVYRVKFVAAGQSEANAVMASVPACALVASHFHETFIFHSDPYGSLLSVSYRTPLSSCLPSSEATAILDAAGEDANMVTKGKVSFGRPGEKAKMHVRPGFDASSQAAAQAVGSDAPPPAAAPEKNADGSTPPPPQSFFQRYWIYLVPLGIFMVIQAVVAPPEPERK